jgi:hypothetical protein
MDNFREAILNAAGNRRDAVEKVLDHYEPCEPEETPDDTEPGGPEAEAEEGNAAIEGAEAETPVPAEAAEPEE